MSFRLLSGNVFDTLPTIPRGSVDCVVTSPPYWALRSYLPKGHALKHLELGSESTPAKYIENQVAVMRLVRDAMADHATCWLNVGDTYSGGGGFSIGAPSTPFTKSGRYGSQGALKSGGAKTALDAGSLCLIPQRLAIALQDDGWIVRSVIVWRKPGAHAVVGARVGVEAVSS